MPIKTKPNSSGEGPPEFEEGTYSLVLTDIRDHADNTWQGSPRPQLEWKFKSDTGLAAAAWTSQTWFEGNGSLSPSKLYLFCKALDIAATQDEEGNLIVPVEQAVGSRVVAFVEKNKKGWPKVTKIVRLVAGPADPQTAAEALETLKETFSDVSA